MRSIVGNTHVCVLPLSLRHESLNKVILNLPMLGSTIPSTIANSVATHTVGVSELVTWSRSVPT